MTLEDLVYINPRVDLKRGTEYPFVEMADVKPDERYVKASGQRQYKGSGARFEESDTLFARITPSLENGKTGFVQFLPNDQSVAIGSTEFIVLRSKALSPEVVYLLSRTHEFRQNAIKSMVGASGRQRVRLECFDSFLVAQPPNEIINSFTETVRPQFQLIQNLADRNENLRQTRDLLVPRLISGELDVSGLDITY